MSAYACPGCGLDAPLTQACPRCEGESICHGDLLKACQGLLLRLPIAHFGKDIENRTWEPPRHLVGSWLAIHAGAHIGGRKGETALLEGLSDLRELAENIEDERGGNRVGGGLPYYSELVGEITKSAIVAVAKVAGSIHGEAAGWYIGPETLDASGKVVKNYGWQLANIIALPTPVPCKGAQGLWPLPPDVLGQVRRQIEIANGVEVQRGQ